MTLLETLCSASNLDNASTSDRLMQSPFDRSTDPDMEKGEPWSHGSPFGSDRLPLARRLGNQRQPRACVLRLLTAVDERDDREGLPAALFFVLHGVDAQVAIGRVDQQ